MHVGVVTRGFKGRRDPATVHLPPGQYLTPDFPVLSAGPTPRIPLDQWRFPITHEAGGAAGGDPRGGVAPARGQTPVENHSGSEVAQAGAPRGGGSRATP